ncbi:NAD(P)H-dependent glycerol-3-phosphate dehydrogenase [Mycoplasma corogypsi]|uniref:NAD(P)H-dependent glycerol-3-phosphate dehydrogenase n=1 Tax=Mycoplasma corogypsi TaxID=2106 RepID=UPI0038731D1A
MKKLRKFGFIGTGAWGSALANVLSSNGHKVMLYGVDLAEINDINNGRNTKYFNSIKFSHQENVIATTSLKELVDFANTFVLAVPSHAIKTVLKQLKDIIKYKHVDIINLSKGFEQNSELLFSEFVQKKFRSNLKNLASLVGPSYAIEVFQHDLTVINIVGENVEYLEDIASYFNNSSFKLVASQKVNGCELFAAAKNLLSIGLGISSYNNESVNTHSALITLGTQEIIKLYQVLYPTEFSHEVAFSYAGIGDIILTCSSNKSRNYSFGLLVAEIGINDALAKNTSTVEGYETAKTLNKLIKRNNVSVPFLQSIIDILLHNKKASYLTDFIANSSKYENN